MADGFDVPPRRQHPAWIVLSVVRSLRAFALPLVILLFTGGREGEAWFLAVGGGLAAVGVASRALAWWQFRYEVTGGELRVRSGVLARQERFVPLERIQAVDVGETPLQRVFGVVGLKIETAAGGAAGSDVTLEALTRADADALRARLGAGRRGVAAASGAVAQPEAAVTGLRADGGELLRRLSMGELVAAGATSGRIGPALAVISFGFQLVDDVVPDWFWERVAMEGPGLSLRGIVTAAAIIATAAWLLAVGSTVLTYGGFELRRDGDRLQVSYGLLDRRRSTIPSGRVQAVTVAEGLLRQPFGRATVRVESAGYGKDTAESGILFPFLRRAEVSELLRRAGLDFAVPLDATPLAPLPDRARRRYAVQRGALSLVWLAGVLVAVAAVVPRAPWWWGLAPLALVPFAALYGVLCFRDSGWALDEAGRFVVRGRAVARVTTITAPRRLQRREVVRGPLQRRAHLATLRAAVASGGGGGHFALVHLDEGEAFGLLGRLGPDGRRGTGDGRRT